jgi:Eco57I restriction-modification methylase
MNKSNLKSYAPQARKDFIAAVTARAQQLGITALQMLPATVSGDVAIIDGTTWPAKVARQREALQQRIQRHGFAQTMEEVAYTWFNRFAALRYMELHDFLDHGHRVLSSRDGGLPELLRHAAEVTLPGLNPAKVQELQLAGNRDDELFKQLLVAQCNELSRSMPFLFERIDDDTELLLPDNLLRTDSIVAKLVAGVPEEDWQEIEVIGWLYQFYISEKKDQVIGKVVKSEDIPAATQLFTPNWIVQYLVQNSVGRLWLMANPTSTLASEWPYYIQPAEQTPEVQAQLDELIQTRIREDDESGGATLNPEYITVLDPACGSGHILVVAYDVLKAIYLERGYRLRDIPRLILEKNLYGLDIDDRAAQMAGFALLMKARADDRRLLNDPANPPKLNVLSLQDSKVLKLEDLATPLAPYGVQRATIWALIEAFEHAKTFGSLIQIPYQLKTQLQPLAQVLAMVEKEGDLYAQQAAKDLLPLVQQAQVLAMQFDAVVANPPYMGNKYFDEVLRRYAESDYERSKYDLFCIFIERAGQQLKQGGFAALVTIQNWMFLSSFSDFREHFLRNFAMQSLVQIGYNSFPEINSKVAQAAAFCFKNSPPGDSNGVYINLNSENFGAEKDKLFLARDSTITYLVPQKDFLALDGVPVAYSLGKRLLGMLSSLATVQNACDPREGINTGDNDRFMRFWSEVSLDQLAIPDAATSDFRENSVGRTWFPCNKGGPYRRWYGNNEYVVDWSNDGYAIKNLRDERGVLLSRPQNTGYFFREGVTWSGLGQLGFSARYFPEGFTFNSAGRSAFSNGIPVFAILAALNSSVSDSILKILAPTLSFTVGNIGRLPFEPVHASKAADLARDLVSISKADWDALEHSWDFAGSPLLDPINFQFNLEFSWKRWEANCIDKISRVNTLETKNNRIFIEAYGLHNEVSADVSEYQVTLTRADREKDCQRLISYAIGCMMGRYSLDVPGLIYAHASNVGFDSSRYTRFPADADGILPVTDEHWFEDDAPARMREFLQAVWGPDTLAENLAWLAESLGTKGSETPEETIRRYIADKFYKDHLQTYKKRPIYWLFSSGKQGAFQALVYLHRYHEGTLARMRAEYVIPLSARMAARLEMLEQDANAASSAAARTKVRKQIESLRKKQTELLAFDEKLRHYADMRITLDLDDGVKVNYGKFGDLLEGVKVVSGSNED